MAEESQWNERRGGCWQSRLLFCWAHQSRRWVLPTMLGRLKVPVQDFVARSRRRYFLVAKLATFAAGTLSGDIREVLHF